MKAISLIFSLTTALLLASCASLGSSNTERLLSASGFKQRIPETAEQKQIYAQMEPYKLYNKEIRGKMIYAYKNPKTGQVFIGGDQEHQQYQKYAVEQQLVQNQRIAAEMQWQAASQWSAWGPYRPWWY